MTPRTKNGQSTLEYVIILVTVIAAIIAAGVVFQPQLQAAYNAAYH